MSLLFANNAVGVLQNAVGPTATVLQLAPGNGASFPSPTSGESYFVTIVDPGTSAIEIVEVTARAGDVLTVLRGRDDTLATSLGAGSFVELRLTAEVLRRLEPLQYRNVANGLAGLDADGRILATQLPLAALTETEASLLYQALTARNAVNGYAGLNENAKLPISMIDGLDLSLYLLRTGGDMSGQVRFVNVDRAVNINGPANPDAHFFVKGKAGTRFGNGDLVFENAAGTVQGVVSATGNTLRLQIGSTTVSDVEISRNFDPYMVLESAGLRVTKALTLDGVGANIGGAVSVGGAVTITGLTTTQQLRIGDGATRAKLTVSTSAPTGTPADGEEWYQIEA